MHSILISKPIPSAWHREETHGHAEGESHKQIWILVRKHQKTDGHWVATDNLS